MKPKTLVAVLMLVAAVGLLVVLAIRFLSSPDDRTSTIARPDSTLKTTNSN
jgi:Flp pilus assembly protein CpaB